MKKILLPLLFAASPLFTPMATAQTTPATSAAPTIKVSTDGHWEYLVISFGKTYYSSPTDIAAKQTGESKLMIFGPLGGVVASEAIDVQRQIDTLGRYGWDLVTVIGSIGGDQQWVFKRRYDPARAAVEAAQIKKEGDDLAAARDKAAKDAAAKPVAPPITQLVDLDAQEASARQAQLNQTLRTRIAELLTLPTVPMARISTSGVDATNDGTPYMFANKAVVYLDVTARALTGNTYRGSSVVTMIDEYVAQLKAQGRFAEIRKAGSCFGKGEIELNVGASLKFNNEWRDVAYPTTYCLK
ncbi:hypothetical protein [Deinococcus aquaticus]|uniref:hypothetical protein n=1 Tax=Deinococcus aquaticus TaxID=328692 RepID=UPI0030B3FD79